MRRLFRLALPLCIVAVVLAAPPGASAQSVTVDTGGPITLDPADQFPTTGSRQNTDLAFWGNTLVQGDTRGIRVFDISGAHPVLLSDFPCNGAWGDVSIWGNLVFRSVDSPQDSASCGSVDTAQNFTAATLASAAGATAQSTNPDPGFEGIQIIDITDRSNPQFVAGVATDCGSHTNTVVPDLANNRVLLYVSSFPSTSLSATPTAFGNTCERLAAGSPAPPNQISGHDKISIVAVPLAAPATASVVNEVTLGTKGYDSFFSFIADYTGDFSNTPGYKGCNDIAVYMPAKVAAAACITEGLLLDITDPVNPTVIRHYTNSVVDTCANGVFHLATGSSTTAAGPNNCMWGTAAFSYDGKRVIFGDLNSGFNRCRGNTEIPSACGFTGATGSINAGADRFYDGTSVTNECDIGSSAANPRDTYNRAAVWMFDVDDGSWPISSAKPDITRYVRQANQGCSARWGGFIPAIGTYQTTGAWGLAGVDVMTWEDLFDTKPKAWYQVRTCTSGTCTASSTSNAAASAAPERSHAWAAYWYNGKIYVSYDQPGYGGFATTGSRGLEVFTYSDPSVAHTLTLPRLNPQVVEQAFQCSLNVTGSPQKGVTGNVNVTATVLGAPVSGLEVTLSGGGVSSFFPLTQTTNGSGQVTFTFKPTNTDTLDINIADVPNMLGCSATKTVAAAASTAKAAKITKFGKAAKKLKKAQKVRTLKKHR
jgi:hypothetical protein